MSFQGKKNVYTCEGKFDLSKPAFTGGRMNRVDACGASRVTIDRDFGVTPMFIRCDCGGDMVSSMYRVDPVLTATHEWYAQVITADMTPGVRDHVLRGGLLLREISSSRPHTNVTAFVSRQQRRLYERQQRKARP